MGESVHATCEALGARVAASLGEQLGMEYEAAKRRYVRLLLADSIQYVMHEKTDPCTCGDSERTYLGHCPRPGEDEHHLCPKVRERRESAEARGVVEDGFGGQWIKCSRTCDLRVVRPGKVQCSCEERADGQQ